MSDERFHAGDTVKHLPTGETWTLACNQSGDYVAWSGWPEGMALASDCVLVRRASVRQQIEMLRSWAAKQDGDVRVGWAKSDLEELNGAGNDC